MLELMAGAGIKGGKVLGIDPNFVAESSNHHGFRSDNELFHCADKAPNIDRFRDRFGTAGL